MRRRPIVGSLLVACDAHLTETPHRPDRPRSCRCVRGAKLSCPPGRRQPRTPSPGRSVADHLPAQRRTRPPFTRLHRRVHRVRPTTHPQNARHPRRATNHNHNTHAHAHTSDPRLVAGYRSRTHEPHKHVGETTRSICTHTHAMHSGGGSRGFDRGGVFRVYFGVCLSAGLYVDGCNFSGTGFTNTVLHVCM